MRMAAARCAARLTRSMDRQLPWNGLVACDTTPCPDFMQRRNFRALPHSALLRPNSVVWAQRAAPP